MRAEVIPSSGPLMKPLPTRRSHDLIPAPHMDVVYIADGARPARQATVVLPMAPQDQAARLKEVQDRRRREAQLERNRLRREAAKEARVVPPEKPIPLDAVIDAVGRTLGLLRSDILGERRKMEAFGREMIVHLARKHTSAKFMDIAVACGKSTACVQDAQARVFERWDRRVGLFYTGDRVTRFETMTYGAVVEEIEAGLLQSVSDCYRVTGGTDATLHPPAPQKIP